MSTGCMAAPRRPSHAFCAALAGAALLAACGGGQESVGGRDAAQAAKKGSCDDRLRTAFSSDRNVTLLQVRPFKAGEPVALENSPTPAPVAASDMCLIKILVGPGNPGTEGAPSTSKGIGIEIWLPTPANWNGIIRTFGSGGWAGGAHADTTRLGRTGAADAAQLAAIAKGYAISSSDHGRPGRLNLVGRDPSFAMREDGTINTTLWRDFSERSMHELAVQTKAAVKSFYGRPQAYAYWDGYSTGGRQGYKIAQRYPKDYDGILAGAPAFNWTRFITNELYPQVAMLRELGGPIAAARLDAVSAAANAACGGAALGFLIDPLQCRYDPSKDPAALCAGTLGNAGVTGTNPNAATCVTRAEAATINKIWYGQTADGSHPDPLIDNASSSTLASGNHLWWGLARGSSLTSLAGAVPFPVASTQVALSLQDPRYAQSDLPYLVNATGNGEDKWKELDYAGLAHAYHQGIALQPFFADINTDEPDLGALRDAGGKVLSYHGWADNLIMGQGSLNYFTRVAAKMGGIQEAQKFNRLFMIPGLAHDSTFSRSGSIDPATGAATNPDKVPLPQPATGRDELFMALRDWVEHGVAPERIDVSSRNGSVTMPLCSHPRKATYEGTGPITSSASYTCR